MQHVPFMYIKPKKTSMTKEDPVMTCDPPLERKVDQWPGQRPPQQRRQWPPFGRVPKLPEPPG